MEKPHGQSASETRPQRLARHSVRPPASVPVQCPPGESRRIDRRAGGGYRPPHAAPEPQRAAHPRRGWRGDRPVRSAGRWPAVPRARTAGEAEAAREGRAYSLRGQGRSEEHTSELQSLMRISYAVFCLKKKKKHTHYE